MTQADFRPKKRSGVVPSGKPRRKIPLLRILLVVLIAFFIYAKFDSVWHTVSYTLNPVVAWQRVFGRAPAPVPAAEGAAWSADSSRFTLDCRGLAGCCEPLPASAAGLCDEADALLTKARARGAASTISAAAPFILEGAVAPSPTDERFFALASLRGRDADGGFTFRRNAAGSWCDPRRGCLSSASAQAPLALGRLATEPDESTLRWVSAASQVRPSLPGRVVAVDSSSGGARVRIYHGRETYTSYEPLRLAAGIRPGMAVTTGTLLGEASWGAAGYTLRVRVRRAGLNADPAGFYSLRAPADAGAEADGAAADSTADSTASAAAQPK